MYCFVILLLFNEMQMSVRRFSAIPHLRALTARKNRGFACPCRYLFEQNTIGFKRLCWYFCFALYLYCLVVSLIGILEKRKLLRILPCYNTMLIIFFSA